MQTITVKKPFKTAIPQAKTAQTATITQNFTNETGLYYYGARYLDPKTSRWLSGDPALGEFIPEAPINEEIRKRNDNLSNDGVFNYVNLHIYNYSNNNPVTYSDPDGKAPDPWTITSLTTGVISLGVSIAEGDVKNIIVDSIAVAADAAAIFSPIPGGAGIAVKAMRAASDVAQVASGIDTIATAVKEDKTLGIFAGAGKIASPVLGRGSDIAFGKAAGFAKSFSTRFQDYGNIVSGGKTSVDVGGITINIYNIFKKEEPPSPQSTD
jgi:RHS repeat-associated protein